MSESPPTTVVVRGVSGPAANGVFVDFRGETLNADVDRAFAPGTPLRIELAGQGYTGKSLGTKRVGDAFALRVRMTNLRRTARERLLALAPPGEPDAQ